MKNILVNIMSILMIGISFGTYSGAISATVAAPKVVVKANGTCGSSNGASLTSKPSANLCAVGAASTVAGSNPWTWSCISTNGGTSASCATVKPVNGACGSNNGIILAAKPSTSLCTAGNPSTVAGTNPWTWSCVSTNGGASASCATAKPITSTVLLTKTGQIVSSFGNVNSIYDNAAIDFSATYVNTCTNLIKSYYKINRSITVSNLYACGSPVAQAVDPKTDKSRYDFVTTTSPSVGDIACWTAPYGHWAIVKSTSPTIYFEQNFKYQDSGKYYAVVDRTDSYKNWGIPTYYKLRKN